MTSAFRSLLVALMLPAALFATAAIGKTNAATRLALVGGETNAGLANVLDTTTALLGKDAGLQLLDRAEVGRVLREHELSLAGLVGAEHAVKAGQLLQADLFAVLEGALTNEVGGAMSLGLVVFDAKTGARYADSALPASNTVSAASATAEAVRAAVEKSRRSPADLHTVGLLLVRNADLPRQFDGLCDVVGLLLERELTASPGIAVLERRRLEQVTTERAVAPEAEGNRLLSSLRMIELDISRDGEGLRGKLALAGADGVRSAPITASVPTNNAALLAHLLAGETERFLKAPTDAPLPNRAAEAARFHSEHLQLRVQRDYTAAVRALDAALALDPEQTKWQEEMAQVLPSAAIESSGDLATCMALAQRGADLMLDLARKAAQDFKPGEPIPQVLKDANLYSLDSLRQTVAAITKSNTAGTAELAALAGKARALRMEIMEPFLTKQSVDKTSFAIYNQMTRHWISPSGLTEDARQDDLLVVRHWIELSHRINPPDGSGIYTPLDSSFTGFFWHYRGKETEDFRQSLEQDQDPVIRLYARAGRLTSSMTPGNHPPGERLAIEREFRLYAQDLLAHGEAAKPGRYRDHVWNAIQTGIVLSLDDPDGWKELLESCRFALAHEDIRPNILYNTIFELDNSRRRKPSEELEVVNGALKLILDKPEAYPGTNATFRRRDDVINYLRKKSGELAAELAGVNTNAPASSPWKQQVCLVDLSKQMDGLAWLFKPIVQDGQVFALALGIHEWGLPEDSVQLVRVPLTGGQPTFLGRAKIAEFEWPERTRILISDPTSPLNGKRGHPDVARAACVGDGCYIAATSAGIYIFPTNGGPVLHLGTTNGLPSEDTHAVACLDGKLYFDAGDAGREGCLASYEFATHKISILASSRRSEHLTPFDDQPPFAAECIVADAVRHRLVMAVSSVGIPSRTVPEISPAMGIWAYSPLTAEYKRLAPLRLGAPSTSSSRHAMSTSSATSTWAGLVDSSTLVVRELGLLAMFDLTNDRLLSVASKLPDEGTSPVALWNRRASGNPDASFFLVNGPFFLRNGWFYSTWPFERMRLADGTREPYPPLRTDYAFEPRESFQLLPDGKHVLAADQFSIWLLELNK
jgi:hypothetical protein